MKTTMLWIAVVAVTGAGCARSQTSMARFYAGVNNTDVDVEGIDVDVDNSFSFGGTATALFGDEVQVGVGADLTYSDLDLDVSGIDPFFVTLTPLVLVRWNIGRTDSTPAGVMQPYVAAGPSGIYLDTDEEILGEDDYALDVGFDLRAGVAVPLQRRVSLFAEYRYSEYEPEFDVGPFDVDVELQTQYFLFGVQFDFGGGEPVEEYARDPRFRDSRWFEDPDPPPPSTSVAPAPVVPGAATQTGTITTVSPDGVDLGELNLWDAPGEERTTSRGICKNGERVGILEQRGDFVRVRSETGIEGWLNARHVR